MSTEFQELDNFLAEHLFGWTDVRDGMGRPPGDRAIQVPKYSKNPMGKILVIEAMSKKGWMCTRQFESSRMETYDAWLHESFFYNRGELEAGDTGEYSPLATARAAKKALELEQQ